MPEWNIEYFDEVSSTQDLARARAGAGEAEGTVIAARTQTAGRGRNGNSWESPAGNLFASIVLRPQVQISQFGQYSFLIAVALRRALGRYMGQAHSIQNKWPNDILVDERKIAGILLEISGHALIAGIGVNVASAPEGKICLNELSRGPIEPEDVLASMLTCLDDVLWEYGRDGFNALREEWLEHAAYLHQPITARLLSHTLNGIFEGLNTDGALRLRLANGELKVVHSGEIFLGDWKNAVSD